MTIKTTTKIFAAAAFGLAASAHASLPAGFIDNLETAKAEAAASGRYILADFSGSDWCGWCKRLDQEVFAQPEFIAGATNKFVLMMVDSPRDTSVLSEHARKANPELVKKYKIGGFPTVLILDETGRVLDQTGYKRGGPEAYLKELDKILAEIEVAKGYETRINAFPKGSLERARLTDEFLMKIGLQSQMRHEDLVKEVLDADPDGKAGLREHYGYFTCSRPAERFLRSFGRRVSRAYDTSYESFTTRDAYKAMSEAERAEIDRKVLERLSKEVLPKFVEEGEAELVRLRALDVPADSKEHFDTVVKAIDDAVKNIRGTVEKSASPTTAK